MKIEREIGKGHKDYEFPLNDAEIHGLLEKLPAKYIEGLERVVITPPSKNEDYKNYGRYVPLPCNKGRMLLFVHQKIDGNFEIVLGGEERTKKLTPKEFKKEAYKAVIHEVGHHVGIKNFKDSSEKFAEDFVKQFSYLIKITEF